MKITIKRCHHITETEITICCGSKMDRQTENLISQLQTLTSTVIGYQDNESHRLPLGDIYYIEYVDEKTFLYTASDIYESQKKLYEWENQLENTSFVRISKSAILNTDQLKSVRSLFSGKLEATLLNGEKQIINRHYVSDFREKFGI